jgi:hypothetical protein
MPKSHLGIYIVAYFLSKPKSLPKSLSSIIPILQQEEGYSLGNI